MTKQKIATQLLHGGGKSKNHAHQAIVAPITTASSFVYENIDSKLDYSYSRVSNPTRLSYERTLANIEGGIYATATASGMAATSLILELLPHQSHIIAMRGIYGGTFRVFENVKKSSSGLQVDYVDLNDLNQVEGKINDKTALIWIETPTNPLLELVDIQKITQFAREKGILTCVDNSFATAWNQQPLKLGADIVMLSTSKFIAGHSDLIGGGIIVSAHELAEKINFIKTSIGAIASPFDAYLAHRGLKTLDVRMERQCANALKIATFLNEHPKIISVYYPGLTSHSQYDLCQAQMRTGGAVVSIRLGGGINQVKQFIDRLNYFVLAESLGGIESMINHSATMSHGSMTKEEKEKIGVYDTTLRLSIGLESIDDLIEDLDRALK